MKKLTVLVLVGLLAGCAPSLKHIPRQTQIVGFDFTKYSNKGFLITPGEYGENYEAIGLLTFSIFPEANKVVKINEEIGARLLVWEKGEIDPAEAIELAYQEAIKRNADAITHFTIKFSRRSYKDGVRFVDIEGVEVTGLLIKRK